MGHRLGLEYRIDQEPAVGERPEKGTHRCHHHIRTVAGLDGHMAAALVVRWTPLALIHSLSEL